MLYVTTRDMTDCYTANRALRMEAAPDGGVFSPFRLPILSEQEKNELLEGGFSATVAKVLNIFFSTRLNAEDIDLCVGRYPYKFLEVNQRVMIVELWHNAKGTYAYMAQCIYAKLCAEQLCAGQPPRWAMIAIEISVMFGIFAELAKKQIYSADIALAGEDFLSQIAAWYARKMGLDIRCIICACEDGDGTWDLLNRAEVSTRKIADQQALEQLIYEALGAEQAKAFVASCEKAGVYSLDEDMRTVLTEGLFSSVVGTDRTGAIISGFYRNNNYIAEPNTASAYGAVQDYRTNTGENRLTLLFAKQGPLQASKQICSALGCSLEELKSKILSHWE